MTASVVIFPGQPLVAVLSRHGWHGIMLAKPGATAASLQVSYPTLEEAEREAREGAEQCGWRYVGVLDGNGDLQSEPNLT